LVAPYGDLMRAQLERLSERSDLPPDMVEVVGKMLAHA